MSDPRRDRPNRVIVILGAGGALGAVISRRLAGEAATDLVLSDVSAGSLDATMVPLADSPAAIEHVLADVRDLDQVCAVVDRAIERFGRLDVLVSNAGVLA